MFINAELVPLTKGDFMSDFWYLITYCLIQSALTIRTVKSSPSLAILLQKVCVNGEAK